MNDSPCATVSLALDASVDREYALPGSGSRSMLFVFDGRQVGAHAISKSGDFVSGSTHASVSLAFWDRAAARNGDAERVVRCLVRRHHWQRSGGVGVVGQPAVGTAPGAVLGR